MSTEITQALLKSFEAGNPNGPQDSLVQGSAVQEIDDLSGLMVTTCAQDKAIKLSNMIPTESCKSTLVAFNREISYGNMSGHATFEGQPGQMDDGDLVKVVYPMCYYSQLRETTTVAQDVATSDGVKAESRVAEWAAKTIAFNIELHLSRGKADFSNAGVFDGNMAIIPYLPDIMGMDPQIRMTDSERKTQDLMFNEYGSNESVVIPVGGVLTQDSLEDSHVRSAQNHGDAEKLLVDLKVLSAYNKISFGKERIVLAGSAQDATGADLKRQWVSNGTVNIEASRFLAGKTAPARSSRATTLLPGQPSISGAAGAGSTSLTAGDYIYFATAVNELGEGPVSASNTVTVTAGQQVTVTITPPGSGTVRYYNLYRTKANGLAATAKFIGKSAGVSFIDLGNRLGGAVTGFLVQNDSWAIKELHAYSSMDMAVTRLAKTKAFFRFCTLIGRTPRQNVILDNLIGSAN